MRRSFGLQCSAHVQLWVYKNMGVSKYGCIERTWHRPEYQALVKFQLVAFSILWQRQNAPRVFPLNKQLSMKQRDCYLPVSSLHLKSPFAICYLRSVPLPQRFELL